MEEEKMRQKEYRLNLASCGQGIGLSFNNERFLKDMIASDFIKKYIPSPEITENPKSDFYISPRIVVKDSNVFAFEENYPEFKYQGNDFYDILFLAEYLLERKRQEANLYSTHSSCAEKEGKAVLLYGWKDTGKTSTAIHLAKEHGFKFFSEGRTVIDDDFNLVGTIQYLEEDNEFLKNKYNFQENCLDVTKLCEVSNVIPKLNMLVYPQITESPFEARIWDDGKNRYHLYEQFSQVIRGVAKNINDYTQPVQSIDTPKLAMQRALFTKKLSDKFKTQQLRGSLEDICKEINKVW